MNLPHFTVPDPSLVRSTGGRDPLGIQPVWSTIGRGLVPHLASPVGQVDGVIAVLLIHWLSEYPLRNELPEVYAKNFRSFFRLMEGILEHHLWKTSGTHCYGTRSLESLKEDFQVTAKDGRTVANGLYQYYRGTCRRARLLARNWAVSEDVSAALAACWDESATRSLVSALKVPLTSQEVSLAPARHHQAFNSVFRAVFACETLREILRARLLGGANCVALAEKTAELVDEKGRQERPQGERKWRVDQLAAWLETKECPARELRGAMHRVRQCEPFLLVLQDCFDALLSSSGKRIPEVADYLVAAQKEIRQRAADFSTLATVDDPARMTQILDLAKLAGRGNREELLRSIIDHHKKCMEGRGRDPLVMVEGEKVVVDSTGERPVTEVETRLKSGTPWDNDYYLWNAGIIYRQLFNGKKREGARG